ncbi:unnamed protein product, partial [Rotaria sp. Silwood1]
YATLKRLQDYSGTKQRLSQLLDEKQQRELEEERPPPVTPCEPILHEEISTEFQPVIATKGESLNPFLRPPRWIIIYRNQQLIFLSALETNWLICRLNSLYHKRESKNPLITTLRLLLPRIKRIQSIFVNTPSLTIPPLIGHPNDPICFFTSPEWLVQLFIFNGTLYSETVDEQTAYCQCLSLMSKTSNNGRRSI